MAGNRQEVRRHGMLSNPNKWNNKKMSMATARIWEKETEEEKNEKNVYISRFNRKR